MSTKGLNLRIILIHPSEFLMTTDRTWISKITWTRPHIRHIYLKNLQGTTKVTPRSHFSTTHRRGPCNSLNWKVRLQSNVVIRSTQVYNLIFISKGYLGRHKSDHKKLTICKLYNKHIHISPLFNIEKFWVYITIRSRI